MGRCGDQVFSRPRGAVPADAAPSCGRGRVVRYGRGQRHLAMTGPPWPRGRQPSPVALKPQKAFNFYLELAVTNNLRSRWPLGLRLTRRADVHRLRATLPTRPNALLVVHCDGWPISPDADPAF